MRTRQRSRRGTPSRETLLEARDIVAVQTSGYLEGGLRIDWERLEERERAELVDLIRTAEDGEGFSLARLGESLARWEELIEKGSGAAGIFERSREEESLRRDVAELTRRAFRRPISRKEERGVFEAIADQVEAGCLFADHVGVLVMVLLAMHSGRPLGPRSSVEPGPVLVVDASFGFLGGDLDPTGRFAAWKDLLRHLEANAWVTLSQQGPQLRIALGPRARVALAGRTPRKETRRDVA